MVVNSSIISNSCVGALVYDKMGGNYTSPFISSLFVDDFAYIKFLENYNYYVNLEPILRMFDKNVYFSKLTAITRDYPLMTLDDIDIHWIHETDINIVLGKWKRRLDRGKELEKIFTWSSSEFRDIHNEDERKELIRRFCNLNEITIFLTEIKDEAFENENSIIKYADNFEGKSQLERTEYCALTWNDQIYEANIIFNTIIQKYGGME